MDYIAVIENAGDNLCAYFPDVPGCVTTGNCIAEIVENAQESLLLYLEGEALPEARTLEQIATEHGAEAHALVPIPFNESAHAAA